MSMLYYYFIYLKLDENRILITEREIKDDNYFYLMDTNGGDKQLLYNLCKMFCLGYIYGSNNGGRNVTNDPIEFT
jgi:hypothetical protein